MTDSADVSLPTIEKKDSTNLFSLLLEDGDEETFSQRCVENRDRLDKDSEQFKFTRSQLNCLYLSKPSEWLSINSEDPDHTGHPYQCYPMIQRCTKNKDRLEKDTRPFKLTYLQLACLRGLPKAVEALLTNGADPNRTAYPPNQSTPIMIAAQQGHYDIVEILAQHEKIDYKINCATTDTLLHLLLNGMHLDPDCDGSHFSMDKCISCMKLLLEKHAFTLSDINAPDALGFTALHRALQLQEKNMILLLLEHGAYIGSRCYEGDAAISLINADVFEEYLNNCILTNGKKPIDKDYQIIYDYSFLDVPRTYSYERKVGSVSQTELLIEISCVPELRRLLKHPVLASFLHVKWYTLRKYFRINFTFYLTFWLCLTLHTLALYDSTNYSRADLAMRQCDFNSTYRSINSISVAYWTWHPSIFLCGLLSLREILKLSILPYQYMTDMENLLEITLLTLNIFVLSGEVEAGVAAFALLLTWTEMVLLINRHRLPSSNIEMYKKVCTSFLKLLAWWSMLIVAFALSFYLLFKDPAANHQNNCTRSVDNITKLFDHKRTSLLKVVLMMTGEFEASSIPFHRYPGVSQTIFILFVFLVTIVLFNLMNGLAVSDTQTIINDAKIVGYVTLAKQIAPAERMVITILNFLKIFNLPKGVKLNPIRKERLRAMFPYELYRVFIFPNQSERSYSDPEYDKYTTMSIVSEIINETKKILQEQKRKREENEHSSNSLDRYSEELHQEYAKRLALMEETTNEKLNKVIERVTLLEETSNEKLNKVIERMTLSEETTNEKLNKVIERVTLLEETTNEKLNQVIELLRQRH